MSECIFGGIPTSEEIDALPTHIRDAYRALQTDNFLRTESGHLVPLRDAYDAACDEIEALKHEIKAQRAEIARLRDDT